MWQSPRPVLLALVALLSVGCGARRVDSADALGPILAALESEPPTLGPLEIRIVYPPADTSIAVASGIRVQEADSTFVLAAQDSTFLFGSVGRGDAVLTVNGEGVTVYPNGTWLAWVPVDGDSLAPFDLEANAEGESARLRFLVRRTPPFRAPETALWVDTASLSPIGDVWLRPNEPLALSVAAAPGAKVELLLASGKVVPFVAEVEPGRPSPGEAAFRRTVANEAGNPGGKGRYVAELAGPVGPDPGHPLAPNFPEEPADSLWPRLRAVRGADTVTVVWPLRWGLVDPADLPPAILNDDPQGLGSTDSTTPGRPAPYSTYHWFFPSGTAVKVSGRRGDQIRLQLSRFSVAWVNASEVQPVHPATPRVTGRTSSVRLTTTRWGSRLRMPLTERVPYRVDELESGLRITLYGVQADMDWMQYGSTDPFVREIYFDQVREDEVALTVETSLPPWGYRADWDGGNLLVEIRKPPEIDPDAPLRGLLVAVDAGHPPGGSTGPSGVREAEVTLGVADVLAGMLSSAGAEVLRIRTDSAAMGLVERTRRASQASADILISIHANALPDGINPFVNSGTSTYYFHRHSVELARRVNMALVRLFGTRDLGIGRADLALVRPSWMPAILTEGLFMMIPTQEYLLTSPEGQRRYALGILQGVEEFLHDRIAGKADH